VGFEPTASNLDGCCSASELRPRVSKIPVQLETGPGMLKGHPACVTKTRLKPHIADTSEPFVPKLRKTRMKKQTEL